MIRLSTPSDLSRTHLPGIRCPFLEAADRSRLPCSAGGDGLLRGTARPYRGGRLEVHGGLGLPGAQC